MSDWPLRSLMVYSCGFLAASLQSRSVCQLGGKGQKVHAISTQLW